MPRVQWITVADAEPNSGAHSYEVLGKLAEGGTTEIFLARAKGVGAVERVVVLKRLKRAATSHVDRVQVFLDEARLAAHLQHPNIAQVFEVGKLGGSFFYAMEFVNGETLQSLMLHARNRKIQVPVRAVLTIASAMAAGLHHAHDRKGSDGQPLGIVHAELTPSNTLVSQEGIVKLIDFSATKAGDIKAKVTPYSSPEQCRGDAVDRRSDLFSLGIVLWELLTLDTLYHRAVDDDIKYAIEVEDAVKPSTMRYDVPAELDTIVLKLLAKDPAQRFQDADELLASIEALAQKLSILLSTADLSRMMRLWFGTKSEPTVDPDAPETATLVINSEEIPADLAATHTPIDDQLDAVRSAAALITARATARSGSTTGRQSDGTVPPELMDNPNENFEQIRDRILARARQKKETKQNQLAGTSGTLPPPLGATSGTPPMGGTSGTLPPPMAVTPGALPPSMSSTLLPPMTGSPAAAPITQPPPMGGKSGTLPPPSMAGTAPTSSSAPTLSSTGTPLAILRPVPPAERHTRTTAQPPIAVIEEAVRRASIADPDYSNGVNGHAGVIASSAAVEPNVKAEEPDKVIVDDELSGSRSASGELGNKGMSGVISRHEAKVSISEDMSIPVEPREAPPATANVAKIDDGGESSTSAFAHGAATSAAAAVEAASMLAGADATAPTMADASKADATTDSTAHAATKDSTTNATAASRAVADDANLADAAHADAARTREAATTVRDRGDARDDAKATRADVKAARDDAKAPRDDAKAARDGDNASAARPRDDAKAARDDAKAARKRDRVEADETARANATARASTAEIHAAGRRPVWLLPVLAGATLLLVVLVVMKLRGGDQPTRASAEAPQPHAQQVTEAAPAAGVTPATDQAAKDQAAKDQAAKDQAAKDQAAKDQAAKDQAAKDQAAKDQTAKDQAAKDQAAKDQAAKDQAAKDQAAKDQAAKDQATNKDPIVKKDPVVKRDPVVKKEPETKKGIEELFAAGDFAKTNTACTKEIVFTAQKLTMCAEAACQTKNTALAKRWINAISKASRPDMIAKCKALGVELESAPPAAPAPSAPPASSPPASSPPSSPPASSPPASSPPPAGSAAPATP
jgi:eukaryotic-like serine/threonine-protein kinase